MSETFRVLITGSRDWADENLIAGALLHEVSRRPSSQPIVVVHGAARGADMLAARVALHYGWQPEPHPADWTRHGRAAGFRRNAEMVALGAGVCLMFAMPCTDHRCYRTDPHASHGTAHCAGLARDAGIPVYPFGPDGAGDTLLSAAAPLFGTP